MNTQPDMLDFLKAASDVDRLRIIGLLTQRNATRAEIAKELNLSARDSVNHLAFLEYVGVLTQRDDVYELNADKLATLTRDGLPRNARPEYIPAPDLDPAAQKVLKSHLNVDGSIRQIPSQPAKRQVILNYLVQAFEPEVNYKEKEVNEILRRFHADTAALRRYLVDANLLARESDCSRYWRVIA
jgi:hypothetical protein